MTELLWTGGPLIWVLLAFSITAVGIFLERYFAYHRAEIDVADLLKGLSSLIKKRNIAEALHETAGTPGPVARVVKSALVRHELPRADLKAIVEEAGQMEVPRLEKRLPLMLAICYVAPLVGLLGTSLGLINVFGALNQANGLGNAADITRGVYSSLFTTAAGLALAIPAYLMYSYLASRVKDLLHDMERGGIEIVNLLADLRQAEESARPMNPLGSSTDGQIIAFETEPRRRRNP
jgi:biopolymer transport protein ExbB